MHESSLPTKTLSGWEYQLRNRYYFVGVLRCECPSLAEPLWKSHAQILEHCIRSFAAEKAVMCELDDAGAACDVGSELRFRCRDLCAWSSPRSLDGR